MWFVLAAEMGVPVRVLQRTMTSREFAEWLAFFNVRAEVQMQQQMMANVKARSG